MRIYKKDCFLIGFSFDRLLDFDRKIAYSKWYFSVADRQRRCAVCLGSHFALICLFLRLNRHSEIFLFCYDCFFRIRKMLVLVCSAFCTVYCFDCYYFLLCKKMRLLASNSRQHFREIAAPKSFLTNASLWLIGFCCNVHLLQNKWQYLI